MAHKIPFDIQVEIVRRLPVKSLMQFRSVSKAWKFVIDGSDFVSRYRGQQQHLLVSYFVSAAWEQKYVSIVDDDTLERVLLTLPPLVNMLNRYTTIGSCHGLLCLFGRYQKGCDGPISGTGRAVLWNLCARKVVDVVVPNVGDGIIYENILGFGVCRETTDAKIVKITHINDAALEDVESIHWKVEVFTLSTAAWRNPYRNLPRKSIKFRQLQLSIDGFLYWLASDHHEFRSYNLIISFDVTSEEFRQVNLPHCLAHFPKFDLSMCKLRESLVVLECGVEATNVWMMMMEEDGVQKSFTKLFTVNITPNTAICGFRKSGEAIIVITKGTPYGSFAVYDPYSKQINDLGMTGFGASIVFPYTESLLLLDQPDFIIY